MDKLTTRSIQGLVILALPVLLALTAGHLLINVWYLEYEYGKSGFPPDTYGFTQQQRLDLATVSIRFLQRREPAEVAIKLLEAQRLPGTDKPLFDQFEISHMLDVKRFTNALWRVQYAAGLIVIGGLLLLLARKGTRPEGYRALFLGGGAAGLPGVLRAVELANLLRHVPRVVLSAGHLDLRLEQFPYPPLPRPPLVRRRHDHHRRDVAGGSGDRHCGLCVWPRGEQAWQLRIFRW